MIMKLITVIDDNKSDSLSSISLVGFQPCILDDDIDLPLDLRMVTVYRTVQ